MIAADTNVWVRYLTNDDVLQAARALEVLRDAAEIFVPKTVLLELEWVLRAAYRLPKDSVRRALNQVLGLPSVRPEEPEQVAQALELYQKGLDFADALHLSSWNGLECFYTFDGTFAKKAARLGQRVAFV